MNKGKLSIVWLNIHLCTQCGCPPIRRRLKGHECLDGAKDTPLHFAAMSGRLDIVSYFLKLGCDKSIMNSVNVCLGSSHNRTLASSNQQTLTVTTSIFSTDTNLTTALHIPTDRAVGQRLT